MAVIAVAAIIMVAALGGFLIVRSLPDWMTAGPGAIVILLVAGLVAVMLLLYLGTMILRTAGLATRDEALGMPEGSIRALIAISLILMFAIIGVTVLYTGIGGEPIQSNGITAAELDRLTNVDIISISVVQPGASPGAERFNVTVRPQLSQTGHDFGLQLLTTVSTLVVAVAGFYFGSRAVAQGAKTAAAARQAATDAAATTAAPATATAVVTDGSTAVAAEGTDVAVVQADGQAAAAEAVSADESGAEPAASVPPADVPAPGAAASVPPADVRAAQPSADTAVEVTLDEDAKKPPPGT
jgi:hypothetical protein